MGKNPLKNRYEIQMLVGRASDRKDDRRQGVRDRDVGCSAEQLERLSQWSNDGSRSSVLGASRVPCRPPSETGPHPCPRIYSSWPSLLCYYTDIIDLVTTWSLKMSRH